MKNWKYIEGAKTGNIKDDAKAKELHKKMMDAKEIAEEWGRASNYQKKDNLEGGRKAAEDAYRKAKKEYEDYAMNSKTGNDTPWEYAHRKPKVINEDKTGAEEFFKQLSDDVKEREKKDDADIEKVGNANLETSVEKGKLGLWNWYVHKDGTIVSGGTSSTEANAKEMARKALEKEKAGNKVGNQSPQERLNKDLSIIKEECRKKGISLSFSELAKELEKYGWDFNELRKLKLPVSVGNAKVGNALNWDENLVGKFVWVKDKGQEWKVYVMQDKGDKVYIRDDDGSQGWVSKTRITGKVGNRVIEKESEMSQELKNLLKKAPEWIKEKIEYAFSHGFTIDENDFINAIKKEAGNSKTGNEASDDKFAYVMREFDEGKLKTPDGKVVTDPAQAKAIAYSESKKTENGLARARKAIK